MATTNSNSTPRLNRTVFIAAAILLAPIAYLAGRTSSGALSHVVPGALGVMIGLPVGVFFGTLRGSNNATTPSRPAALGNTLEMEQSILAQLRQELVENQSLFEARKGSTTMYARIDYIMPFWTAIKASGRLFVMQDATLLHTLGTAYYWLEQATHLERLAYEAKYSPDTAAVAAAERLVGEARLLDGQLETSLKAAISAIDSATAAR